MIWRLALEKMLKGNNRWLQGIAIPFHAVVQMFYFINAQIGSGELFNWSYGEKNDWREMKAEGTQGDGSSVPAAAAQHCLFQCLCGSGFQNTLNVVVLLLEREAFKKVDLFCWKHSCGLQHSYKPSEILNGFVPFAKCQAADVPQFLFEFRTGNFPCFSLKCFDSQRMSSIYWGWVLQVGG